MKTLYEIIKIVLPSLITGIFSYLLTKHTYSKNIPLDYLKIAYNRFYYPIYTIISNDKTDVDYAINKIEKYIVKYKKYIDKSTLKVFNYLCKCDTKARKKEAYLNFKNNIYSKASFLRRRLGYLEPSILQLYTYSSKSEQSTIRILLEIFFYIYYCYYYRGCKAE